MDGRPIYAVVRFHLPKVGSVIADQNPFFLPLSKVTVRYR
jgi:hypothetical protein